MSAGCFPNNGAILPLIPPISILTWYRCALYGRGPTWNIPCGCGEKFSFTSRGLVETATMETLVTGALGSRFLASIIVIPFATSGGNSRCLVTTFSLPFSVERTVMLPLVASIHDCLCRLEDGPRCTTSSLNNRKTPC